MIMQNLEELLSGSFKQWQMILENRATSRLYVEQALDYVLELGVIVTVSSDEQEKKKIQQGIKTSAPLVEDCLEYIGRYVAKQVCKGYSTWVQDDWESWRTLCTLRSQLEFLKTLYLPFITENKFEQTEIALLDEAINENSGRGFLPTDFIPAEIPTTHFWWWLPEEPS